MKKISLVHKITFIFFLLLIAASFFIAIPINKKIGKKVTSYTSDFFTQAKDLLGVNISYDSFSPSVLSGFKINNIEITNQDKNIIVSVDKAYIRYKLLDLLRGNFNDFIRGVNIKGVKVDVSALLEFFTNNKELFYNPNTKEFDYTLITSFIPPNVELSDIEVSYKKDKFLSTFLLNEIKLRNSRLTQSVNFAFDCNVNLKFNSLSQAFSKLTGNLSVSGQLTQNLENSSIFLGFSNFTDGTYTLNKINILATCKNQIIDIHTVQPVFPLELDISYDLANNNLIGHVNTKDLKLSSVLTAKGIRNKDLDKAFKELKLSIQGDAFYTSAENDFIYNSSGLLTIPSYFVENGALLNFNLSGDEKSINIESLSLKGETCDVDLSLNYLFENIQLAGYLNIGNFLLPNQTSISTEMYFDPFDKGFSIFSPQIYIGSQVLTALSLKILPQEDSIDFDLELSDYSSVDSTSTSGEFGNLFLDGSYLFDSNYIQTGLSFTNIYLNNILKIIKQLLPEESSEQLDPIIDFTKPYILAGEGYFSTDFNSITYNLPYFILANYEKENQAALISLNGNENSILLDKFNLILGDFAFETKATLDFMPETKDMFFTLDINSSAVPYHFTGSYMANILSVSGDYGSSLEILINQDKSISGFLNFDNLPFMFKETTIISSLNSSFYYDENKGPEIVINRFELEESDPNLNINPRFSFIGSGTKYGAQLKSITYSDLYSSLQGSSDITININDKIFDSVGIILNLSSAFSDETINIDLSISNPDKLQLNKESILNSLYMNGAVEISHFGLNRFTSVKNNDNELNASFYISGTLEHPYASINVEKLSLLLANDMMFCSGSAFLEDTDLSINNISIETPFWALQDFTGQISMSSMTASLSAIFKTKGSKNFNIPMELKVSDSYFEEGKLLPENLIITLSTSGIAGSIMNQPIPFSLTALYSPDYISFYSSDNLGLVGNYSKEEGLYATAQCSNYLSFDMSYTNNHEGMEFKVNNIFAQLPSIYSHFDLEDILVVKSGLMKGNFSINGDFDTPDFKGAISITDPIISLPSFLEDDITTDKLLLTASNNEFSLLEKVYKIKNDDIVKLAFKMTMNKWQLDTMNLSCQTLPKEFIPLSIKTPVLDVNGDLSCDFKLNLNNNIIQLDGNLFGDNIDIITNLQDLTANSTEKSEIKINNQMNFKCDLNILLGTHVMLNFNPLLRTIFVPNTKINLLVDTIQNLYKVDGELKLKSGDIAYLNRNFYIKNGSIKFNPQDIINPQVTITAETREKDQRGQSVRIILSAEKQNLLSFNPKFSSIPPKSEAELQLLLGQIVIGDSDNISSLLLSAGDYYFQTMFVRDIENKLRDLLNFDIFSLRTNVFQNTLNMSLSGNLSKEISIGNFFDNSTVYIGKYLGNALYVDAMLHLSIEDGTSMNTIGPIKLQPEFGLELDLPVVNIRWNMEPDITALLNKQFVPATSVSLSWKISF